MAKSSRTKNSILNLLSSLGGQLLITILRFVVRTVFIQTLGKSYLGINGYFADILNMLSLAELGFDTAINYKMYKPLAEHDDKRIRVLIKFYKLAYRAVGLVILSLGLLLIPLLPHLIKDYSHLVEIGINPPLIFVLFLLQTVFSYLFFAYRSAVMVANQKKYILDVADYIVTIAMNAAQIAILVLTKDFIIYTAAAIAFVVLKNFVNAMIAQKFYPQFFIPEPDRLSKEEVRDLFKDCGALFIYKINNTVLKATDNMVLGAFAGMVVVGLYSNYLLFYTTIKSYLRKLYSAVKASTGNLFATESVEAKYRFFEVMNFLTVILYGTAAIGIAVCANELITVWIGTDYLIAQPFSILVGIEILTSGLKQNLGQIRTVTGVFRQAWKRPILSAIINLVSSIILVQFIGIYGVILGTILADCLTNLAIDPKIIHKYSFEGYKPVSYYYIKNLKFLLVLAAVGAFDMWVCSWLLTGHGWFSVIIHIGIVALTVPSVFIFLYRKSYESKYLGSIIRRILGRTVRRKKPAQDAPESGEDRKDPVQAALESSEDREDPAE